MNRVEHHNKPYYADLKYRTFSHKGSARYTACAFLTVTGLVSHGSVPTDEPTTVIRHKTRYHSGVANLELEQAVIRAAQ